MYKKQQDEYIVEHLQGIKFDWKHGFMKYKEVPEKFTLINIHSNKGSPDNHQCGESGDLYAWNIDDWKLYESGKEQIISISQESIYIISENLAKLKYLPLLPFYTALELCNKMNGHMYYENKAFFELNLLEGLRFGPIKVWTPFTDLLEEGQFHNIINNETFEDISRFWLEQEPHGGKSENFVGLYSNGSIIGLEDDNPYQRRSREKDYFNHFASDFHA